MLSGMYYGGDYLQVIDSLLAICRLNLPRLQCQCRQVNSVYRRQANNASESVNDHLAEAHAPSVVDAIEPVALHLVLSPLCARCVCLALALVRRAHFSSRQMRRAYPSGAQLPAVGLCQHLPGTGDYADPTFDAERSPLNVC